MSLDDLRDLAGKPRPRPAGALERPRELTPVREPPRGLPRRNEERQKRVKPRQFGEQAARCRAAPCACCGRKGASVPHHWPTTAAGGLDADTAPLCSSERGAWPGGCHEEFHAAGSPSVFLDRTGCDIEAAIKAMRRKPDHSCERFALLVEDGTPGREKSEYRCQRCGKTFNGEQ